MNRVIDFSLLALVLSTIWMMGSSRLITGIRVLIFHGYIFAYLTLILGEGTIDLRIGFIALFNWMTKSWLVPHLLIRAMRRTEIRAEHKPILSYLTSIVLSVIIFSFSLWLLAPERLHFRQRLPSNIFLPTAMFLILCGLLLIIARSNALMQVIGYLTLENGVILTGLVLARDEPLLLEMGILIDILGVVFIMGIVIFHIGRTFESIGVEQLTLLKDD